MRENERICVYNLRYLVYIDDNGDAAGNYTVLALRSIEANHSLTDGLHPIGTFSQPDGNQIPVRVKIRPIYLRFVYVLILKYTKRTVYFLDQINFKKILTEIYLHVFFA